jgi:hypothetical protein
MNNIYKNMGTGKCLRVAKHMAEQTGEPWFLIGGTGMVANFKGAKGYEQYDWGGFCPNGKWVVINAKPQVR